MAETLLRLLLLVRFIAFMCIVYLALHMLVARMGANPAGKVMGFFATITNPLTRPVRTRLGPETPETRVRAIALGGLFVIWLLAALAVEVAARRAG